MNCERNKKTEFIQNLLHKNACYEQFLSTFAHKFEIVVSYGIISMVKRPVYDN